MASHGYDDDFDIVDADGWNQYDPFAMGRAPQQPAIKMTQQMTTKVAPAYDGRSSFFAFEDAIDDWCDITELEPEKRGPAQILATLLFHQGSPGSVLASVHAVHETQQRHDGFTKEDELTGNRLIESWMDLLTDLETTSPEAIAHVARRRQEHEARQAELAGIAAATPGQEPHVNVPWTGELALAEFLQLNADRRAQQRLAFPLGDNLSALIFVSLADLTQDQRNTLTSIMTHRGKTLDQYNVQELRDLFLGMFCTTRTAVDNPMMQPSGIGQRRSFLVLEEGELEGTDAYWAEDDEDGAEGFLDALEDVFWVYDDAEFTWHQKRFQGRQTRRGKGKGRRKVKGKGRGGRRFFQIKERKRPRKRKKKRPLPHGE